MLVMMQEDSLQHNGSKNDMLIPNCCVENVDTARQFLLQTPV